MHVELPPVIAVRRFLRQQALRKDVYRTWFDATYDANWKHVVGGRRAKPSAFAFAEALEKQLIGAGAFNVTRKGAAEQLKLRASSSYDLDGYALWPIKLAQNLNMTGEAYLEDALSLVRTGARIAPGKVSVYEAPLFVCWTRHALERLCERGGAEAGIEDVLSSSTEVLLDRLATALALELHREDLNEGTRTFTIWVPWRGGLAIFTNRLLAMPSHAQDAGYRFSFSKQRYSDVYVRNDLLLPDTDERSFRSEGQLVVSTWFATTFVSHDQLSSVQRRYSSAFKRLVAALGPKGVSAAFTLRLEPDYKSREGQHQLGDNDAAEQAALEVKSLLASDSFQGSPRFRVAYLVDPDTKLSALRSA